MRLIVYFLLFCCPAFAQYETKAQYSYGNNAIRGQMGRLPYLNQPGFGYYYYSPTAPAYPIYNAPVPLSGLPINRAGVSGFYWRAPSGYYYPWSGANYGAPVVVVQQQQQANSVSKPSVQDMMKDMRTFLDEKKNKFAPDDYAHLCRRLQDITIKYSALGAASGGNLDPIDEDNIRKDLSMLSGDISRRVKP